jgi:phosphatidylserine/phosphatidylglycerophosphate/cardiolipin synthase-like enzyme
MTAFLPELGPPALEALASAVESGRLRPPFSAADAARYVAVGSGVEVSQSLSTLTGHGMTSSQVAIVLRLLADERREAQRLLDRVELVWSGPETPGSASRDTSVVVRHLFGQARSSVLVANYAFDRPKTEEARARAKSLFAPLAENLDANPALSVRFVVNVERPRPAQPGGDKSNAVLIREFVTTFQDDLWPGTRLPDVFFDPRALLPWDDPNRASMHAKCLAVDDEWVLITSANFTRAAQTRNLEAGVLIRDPQPARALRFQLDSLVSQGKLKRVLGA